MSRDLIPWHMSKGNIAVILIGQVLRYIVDVSVGTGSITLTRCYRLAAWFLSRCHGVSVLCLLIRIWLRFPWWIWGPGPARISGQARCFVSSLGTFCRRNAAFSVGWIKGFSGEMMLGGGWDYTVNISISISLMCSLQPACLRSLFGSRVCLPSYIISCVEKFGASLLCLSDGVCG